MNESGVRSSCATMILRKRARSMTKEQTNAPPLVSDPETPPVSSRLLPSPPVSSMSPNIVSSLRGGGVAKIPVFVPVLAPHHTVVSDFNFLFALEQGSGLLN
ncbi:unnamed protein product [Pleuronectes platessa]|uniref:Uncharacterized protein n=1 Tax=Pleuronectes platessa TaxID=8262 RepID=A0A9N7YVS8_PLEPL|nr:unnamed protein product [Pleuronectes platessa]